MIPLDEYKMNLSSYEELLDECKAALNPEQLEAEIRALDEQMAWSFGFEADQFLIRGLKLPQGEGQLDAISRFQERMIFLDQWREIFLDLFGAFLQARTDSKKWKKATADIREWIQGRPGRR